MPAHLSSVAPQGGGGASRPLRVGRGFFSAPDEARLTVFYAYGRWFTVWEALEEKKEAGPLPEWRRWSVVRIVEDADPSSATGVTFLEV